ncbi:glycosyltransferase [Gordonia sp. 852002-51296_SCH5728562-b]|uniref:glycosyltransferase n=1 Tax=Gordonia sp. 852002-51296_SCH5728562-b TaxID=1834101 RepID=UPI003FA5E5E7
MVCAYTEERLESVTALAQAVLAQAETGDELILVVDHNQHLLDRLTREFCDRAQVIGNSSSAQGLSGARNSGVAQARNDVVVFLDDDSLLEVGGLASARRAFDDPRIQAIGGEVRPDWEGGVSPSWFPAEFRWVVGCDYLGLPKGGTSIRNPIGAAMAVRRSALERIGGFSEDLGRVGTLPAGCEETLMGIEIRARIPDSDIVRVDGFTVDHTVTRSRQTRRYYLRRCLHEGRSKALLSQQVGSSRGLESERKYVTRTLPRGVVTNLVAALRGDMSGLDRAVMIIAGLLATAWGMASARSGMSTTPPARVAQSDDDSAIEAFSHGELVSVVVATVGRASLRATVESVLAQSYTNIQLIVVDNSLLVESPLPRILGGITDDRLTYVVEPVKGVSVARNAGIAAATGRLIAFTDDDARADEGWIEALVTDFSSDDTGRLGAITGRVTATELTTVEQRWFEDAQIFDKGLEPAVYSYPVEPTLNSELGRSAEPSIFYPWTCGEVGNGNNMAFRAEVLAKVGRFDETLGPGTPTRGGEDLDLIRRALLAGYVVAYRPGVLVGHRHRSTTTELRSQMYGYGVGMSSVLTKLVVSGYLMRILAIVPAGFGFLVNPGSARNEAKPEEMHRGLVFYELAGYMNGPVMYARSRLSRVKARRRRVARVPASAVALSGESA